MAARPILKRNNNQLRGVNAALNVVRSITVFKYRPLTDFPSYKLVDDPSTTLNHIRLVNKDSYGRVLVGCQIFRVPSYSWVHLPSAGSRRN